MREVVLLGSDEYYIIHVFSEIDITCWDTDPVVDEDDD